MSEESAAPRSPEEEARDMQAKLQGFSEGFIEGLIQTRLAASEFLPSELETLEMRREREGKAIREALRASARGLKEGLKVLAEHAPEDDADFVRKLQAVVEQPTQPEIGEASDDDANPLAEAMPALIETARSLLEQKHHKEAKAAAQALCILYPEVPHPYVLAGTALWYVDGLEAAVAHYTMVTEHLFEQPMINYFAADVFLAAGEDKKCQALLRSGLELCEGAGPDAAEFKPQIEAFLEELATSGS